MSIIGSLIIVLGIISAVYGNYLNNDFGTQLNNLFETGRTNPGDVFMIIGIGVGVVGLILLVIGLIKHLKKTA